MGTFSFVSFSLKCRDTFSFRLFSFEIMHRVTQIENVGYIKNAHARDVIDDMESSGWGIEAMSTDEHKDTWITFYKYQDERPMITNIELGQLLRVEGYGFMFLRDKNTAEIKAFQIHT